MLKRTLFTNVSWGGVLLSDLFETILQAREPYGTESMGTC
jgi:hypothetical protein